MYIDKEGMKIKLEKIKDIMKMERKKDVEKKDSKIINAPKNVDLIYLIDATGSMGSEITACKI